MKTDIFNHFIPKEYFERLHDLIPGHVVLGAFPRIKALVDVEARLRLLDEFGEMQHVLSLANPPLELIAPPNVTPQLARIANDAFCHPMCKISGLFSGIHRSAADERHRCNPCRDRPHNQRPRGARRAGFYQCRRQAD
jgi:hypothetical protein